MNTAELLLANLERLLSSPTSAETIRKLIFDLAIRGKLSIQSDNDEPASALIAKVIRTAQAEDRKFSAEPAVTQKPFEVPSGWEWVRLGNTGKIFNGTSASAGEKVRLSKTTDGLPFIATKDVGYGREPLCYENGLKVPHGDKDYKVAKSGAVLICAEGGSAGKKVGQTDRPICFGNKLYANETWAGIESGYILSLYQSNFFYDEFKARMAGIIGGIARSDFRSLRIPLPPLAEQKRIVAKVDELMALCDRLEDQLKERDVKQAALAKAALAKFTEDPTPENLQLLFHPSFSFEPDDLRATILDLAIKGRVSSQDITATAPSDTELEHENLRICKQLKLRSQKHTDCEFVEPFSIPSNWRWVPLGNLGVHQTGTTPSKNFPELFNGPVPFIKPADISSSGIDYSNESLSQLGADDFGRVAPNGSLLMVCIGTIGKSNLITRPCSFNQQINSLTPCKYVDSKYLLAACRSRYFIGAAWAKSTSTTIALINKGNWCEIPIPLPPFEEQKQIALKSEQLMKLVDSLEAQLEASRTIGEKLLEAMVAELTGA